MKECFGKMNKKTRSLLTILLCVLMVLTVFPSNISYAADGDVYSYKLISYNYNKNCHGYYFTPKATGKYDTVVLIHGQGGVNSMKNNLVTLMNSWVKAGYFSPMVVVVPVVDDYNGTGLFLEDHLAYIDNEDKFATLLQNIESGALSPQIDTEGDILVGGFSLGGMAAVQAGAVHNTRIKKIGALSPSQQFYLGEGSGGYYNNKKDIYYSKDPEAFAYLSAGQAEDAQFIGNINRYKDAIESTGNNKEGLVTMYQAPTSWGGHAWPLAQKEIFMFLYFNEHGTIPSQSLVEQACNSLTSYQSPSVVSTDTEHPAPAVTIEPYDGDVLIDLDMSTYVKDTTTDPKTVATSIGSITNNGTLASSTVVKMSSLSGGPSGLSLSKQTFSNAMGSTTSYLKRTINYVACYDNNVYSTVENAAMEKGANTISFWANYVPVNQAGCSYNFLDYNVTYDGETDSMHLFSLGQGATTEGKFALTGRWNPTYADITDEAAGEWAHYVITNPAYSSNNRKVMKIYINGKYVYSKMVVKPSGNVTSAKIAFGGETTPTNQYLFWSTNISLGDVKVYDGELTANEVLSEYTLSKDKYIVSTSQLPNITGYTFSDSTVTYDGQKHMINVSATANATEGATVTYTCNGQAFTGATEIGTYTVTATISKSGYNDLVLTAKLMIKSADIYAVKGIAEGDRFALSSTGENKQKVYVVDKEATGIVPTSATGLTSVDFYVDGNLAKTVSTAPYCYEVPLESGNHTLKVIVKRNDGTSYTVGTYNYSATNMIDTADAVKQDFESGSIGGNVTFGSQNLEPTESCTYQTAPGTGSKAMAFSYDGSHESGTSYLDISSIAVPESKLITLDYDFYSANSSGNAITHHLKNSADGDVVQGRAFGALASSKYSKDTWHHASYVFDFNNLTYRGYLDGYEFERGTLNNSNDAYVRFYLNRYSVGTLYIDNVKYSGKKEGTALQDITGYTLSDSTVTYDGQKHLMAVSAAAGATEGTTVTYTCNGQAFTGATQVGTYNVTATVSKSGYNDLVLNAKLVITPAPLEFNVAFDSENKTFNASTNNALSGANRILLVVKDSKDNVVYMDAINAVTDDSVSFDVDLGNNLKAEEYSFTLSSMGDTIDVATATCESDVEVGGSTEPMDITGYTFSDSTVTYDGQNHMINVLAAADATEGTTVTYTCNGQAFTG
ncbi:MAG: hypothetical protein IKT62_03770, partial [Firmicutes bacterium]|nr:hypothetical protein [Bacillota bacterium]